jgi:hypothetical protein
MARSKPPVSESLYCDALISAFSGDEVKAILELGVAAEVEVTQMLIAVAGAPPLTPSKAKFLKQKPHLLKFYEKLCEWPQKLGLQDAISFRHAGLYPGWVDAMREVYRFRGSVAHSGQLTPGTTTQHLSSYVYAANALFAYCRSQRETAGVAPYAYAAGRSAYHQMLAFHEALFFGETYLARGAL